jgi:hypothetical protein
MPRSSSHGARPSGAGHSPNLGLRWSGGHRSGGAATHEGTLYTSSGPAVATPCCVAETLAKRTAIEGAVAIAVLAAALFCFLERRGRLEWQRSASAFARSSDGPYRASTIAVAHPVRAPWFVRVAAFGAVAAACFGFVAVALTLRSRLWSLDAFAILLALCIAVAVAIVRASALILRRAPHARRVAGATAAAAAAAGALLYLFVYDHRTIGCALSLTELATVAAAIAWFALPALLVPAAARCETTTEAPGRSAATDAA